MSILLRSAMALAISPVFLSAVHAEPSNKHNSAIQEIIVTLPIHQDEQSTALSLKIMAAEELRRIGGDNIGEVLQFEPGLASSTFGPGVGRPVIRGQQGVRVSVLQNGTATADVSAVSPDHAVAVETALTQKVEVLRGPSTLLYSGAIGGVVNVIDNRVPVAKPEHTQGSFELRHASVNDERVGVLAVDSAVGDLAFHVDGVSRKSGNIRINGKAGIGSDPTSEGFVDNSFAESRSYTLGSSYILDNGYVGIAINELNNDYGIPPEEFPGGEEISIQLEQTRIDLRSVLSFEDSFVEQLRSFVTDTDYEHTEIEEGEVAANWANSSTEFRFELTHAELAGFHGAVGLQFDQREFEVIGEAYIPSAEATHWGLFIVEDYHLEDLRIEAGLRFDSDEIELDNGSSKSDFTGLSASLSGLLSLSDSLSLGLAYAHAERAPEIEELYADGPHLAVGFYEEGDSELDTEAADSIDLTLSYEAKAIRGFVTVFYSEFSDYIYLRNTGTQVAFDANENEVPVNSPAAEEVFDVYRYSADDATFYGVEAELSFPIASLGSGKVNGRVFGDWISGELDQGGDVPRLPPSRLGAEVSYENGGFYSALNIVDAASQSNPGDGESETDGFTRVDMQAEYSWDYADNGLKRSATTFLRLKNLTDEEIRNSVSFLREIAPEPGRSIEAGLRVAF